MAAGTLTDPDVIREDLAAIRERGWGFSWEETYAGAWAVAAPLIDDETEVAIGAIGAAAPTIRHTREIEDSRREVVLATAARAMRSLGYRPGAARGNRSPGADVRAPPRPYSPVHRGVRPMSVPVARN